MATPRDARAADEPVAGHDVAQRDDAQRPASRHLPVRVALSKAAAGGLGEIRLLRLLGIELDDDTPLATSPSGPLDDDHISVWIDLPSPDRVRLQVARPDGALSERTLQIDGYAPDVAARFVAITTAEMVRSIARPTLAPEPALPHDPTGGDDAAATGSARARIDGGFGIIVLPGSTQRVLFGPELGIDYRVGLVSTRLHGRWLTSQDEPPGLRWLEVGLSSQAVLGVAPGLRLSIGGVAAAAAVLVPGTVAIDGVPSGAHTWTARLAGRLVLDGEITDHTWIGLALEPGACLRFQHLESGRDSQDLGGFALHAGVTIGAEL